MPDIERNRHFVTSNLDLSAYLLLEMGDSDFLGFTTNPSDPRVVLMTFKDPAGKYLDLERTFIHSKCKEYRGWHKWLLKNIHQKKSNG